MPPSDASGPARAGARAASQPSLAEKPGSGPDLAPLSLSRAFWTVIGYAVLFGLTMAVAALLFLGLVQNGTEAWFTLPDHPDWFSGSLWWVAVTGVAGVLVGMLRRMLHLPARLPGTIREIREERVEPPTVWKGVVVSLVSLVGGASVGPEDALGKMGGGLGTWMSARRELDEDTTATNTLTGMAGAFGGLLSSPILGTSLVIEVARPKRTRFGETLVGSLVAATVAFAVYYPIAGGTFLGLYTLPPFEYENWQLVAAVPLGLVAGALALITLVAVGLLTKLTAPLADRTILRSTLGGVAFGLVGVALPLTMMTGTDQLTTLIHEGAALGAGVVIAVLLAKILAFAICEATGFIGGQILVLLFIGGSAGVATHLLFPGIPEGLAFATMFAAILGALVAAPFSLIVLTAVTTQVGALQLAPVAVAVITSYLAVSGSGALMALMRRGQQPAPSAPSAETSRDAG